MLNTKPELTLSYTPEAGKITTDGKVNTKQEILNVALDLFSAQGFEATSVSQIAEAVGIRKASLYSHFASKQEILDSLVRNVLEQYEKHSIFARADWDDPDFTKDKQDMTADAATKMIIGQIRYILHDPLISKGRKMLTVEQFQNPMLAELQTKLNYSDVMKYFTGFVRFLIRKGKLSGDDPESMAAQLCLPVSVWINLCDRESAREDEVMQLVERHIRQFFSAYRPKKEQNSALYASYKVKNIYGENFAGFTRHCREAARALIVTDDKILLSHEVNVGQWMIPGGGVEGNETPEDCCIREAAEETGLIIKPGRCFLVINEFYEDWKYVSYYFECKVAGHTDRNPTKREIEVGAAPEWLGIKQAADIFSHYGDYAGSDEERRGIYLREHLAMSEFSDKYN